MTGQWPDPGYGVVVMLEDDAVCLEVSAGHDRSMTTGDPTPGSVRS
ncbi:hypothetical protein SAMN05661080_03590 [Modestobacter sp. DSM 44400]|nr:hypothetical protein [Modestobacter sp. DSM 44400]SDY47643.1 hypothetical protein SAMN05661080_03590 [Modestobacter sp. DSM 44400]